MFPFLFRTALSYILLTGILLALTFTNEAAPPPEEKSFKEGSAFVPGQAIVGFKDENLSRGVLKDFKPQPLGNRTYLIETADPPGASITSPELITWELVERLISRDDVEFAHPNYYVEPAAASTTADPSLSGSALQWNLQAINISGAWDVTMGDPSIRIALIDTGRTDHPDLLGQWHPTLQYNSADPSNPSAEDTGTWRSNANRVVYWRHGTHVASIASGTISSAADGTSTTGVCPDCVLLPIRYYGDTPGTVGTFSSVIEGINWAVSVGEADVINMSLESFTPCTHSNAAGVRSAIENAINNGVHIVAAAGNQNSTFIGTPASCPGVVSVAAVDQQLERAPFSNYLNVTLAAPGGGGVLTGGGPTNNGRGAGINCPNDPDSSFNPSYLGVVAAWTTSPLITPSNAHCHRHLSGTSMSTPHVAGVIGLLLSIDPDLTPAEVMQILEGSASPLPGCGNNCGAGLLNADAAVSTITDDLSWLPAVISYILQ